MVDVFGNSIIGAYTGGVSVKEIYTNGVKVWPTSGPEPPESYYIQWSPKLSTGTFSIDGVTYNFSDYPTGIFYMSEPIITESAFINNHSIMNIYTNALIISSSAFQSCSLNTLTALKCTYVDRYAFAYCKLRTVRLSECKYVSMAAFRSCRRLSWVTLPVCSYIGNAAFQSCSSLSQATLPMCKSVGYSAFADCTSLITVSLPECEYIGNSAFQSCSSLSQVSLPVCSYIGSSAFQSCSSLSQVSLPVCEYIGNNAFIGCSLSQSQLTLPVCTSIGLNGFKWAQISQVDLPECIYLNGFAQCYSLETVSAPKCSYIGTNAFFADSNITRIDFPECLSIENGAWDIVDYVGYNGGAFAQCFSLNLVNLPKCEYLGSGAFAHCHNLCDVYLPVCEYVGSGAFQACWNLGEVNLPECKYLGSYAFRSAEGGLITSESMKLSVISLGKCSYIGQQAFYSCTSLGKITIGFSAVCSLYNSGVFDYTPIASGTGSIYVPSSLVSAYKSASEWSYFSNRIFPIE